MKYGFLEKHHEMFPPLIIFALTNKCTNRCVHCLYPQFKEKQKEDIYLDWSVFKKAIDEIAEHEIYMLRFTAFGEPLLHPDLFKMLKYASERIKYPINLTTNGTLLDEEKIDALFASNIDVIDISVDAFSCETYKLLTKNDKFDHVKENVLRLIEKRNLIKSNMKIMVSIIDQKEVEDEVQDFVSFWEGKADKVLVRTFYSFSKMLDSSKEKYEKSIVRYPCPQLWKRITIEPDGKLSFCVVEWFSRAVIGDLNTDDTIHSVWTGEKYRELRDKHLRAEYSELSLCGPCTDWQASKWEYGFEKAIKEVTE